MSDDVIEHEPGLADAAEEVRAYLVALRGGAPFLSGPDGRLLVDWLEAGIPVAAILAALDHAAARRAKRPARTRLGLGSCRGDVAKLMSGALTPMPLGPLRWPGLAALGDDLAVMEVAEPLKDARATLSAAILALSRGAAGDEAELVARQAMAACRRFQEAAWASLGDERMVVLARASAELSSLVGVLSPGAMEAAVEELARDHVRGAAPLVSARVVWDRMIGAG